MTRQSNLDGDAQAEAARLSLIRDVEQVRCFRVVSFSAGSVSRMRP